MKEDIYAHEEFDANKYSLASIVTEAIVKKYGSMNEFQMLALSGKIDFFQGLQDVISILRTTYETEDKEEQDRIDEELLFIDMIIIRLIHFINEANIKDYKKYDIDFDLSKNIRALNQNQIKHVYYFFKKFIHILTVDEWYSYLVYLYTNLQIYINYDPFNYKHLLDILALIENSNTLPSNVSYEGECLANLYCSSELPIKIKLTYIDFYLENVSDEYKSEGIIIDDDQKNNQVVTKEDLQEVYDLKSTRIISMYDPMVASKITATSKKAYEGVFNIHDGNTSTVNEVEIPISCNNVPDKKLDQKDLSEKRKAEAKDFMTMAMEEVICAESSFEVHRAFQNLSHGTATTATLNLKNMFSMYMHILTLSDALLKNPEMESFMLARDINIQFGVMVPELLSYNFGFLNEWLNNPRFKLGDNFKKAFIAAAYVMFKTTGKTKFSEMIHDIAYNLEALEFPLVRSITLNAYNIEKVKGQVEKSNKNIRSNILNCKDYSKLLYLCNYFKNTDNGYKITFENTQLNIETPFVEYKLDLLLKDNIGYAEEIGLLDAIILDYSSSYSRTDNAKMDEYELHIITLLDELQSVVHGKGFNKICQEYYTLAGDYTILCKDITGIIDLDQLDYLSIEGLINDIKSYEIRIIRQLETIFKKLSGIVAELIILESK